LYHNATCLVQIACAHQTYAIDPFIVFSSFKQEFSPIYTNDNNNIVKLVFSENDVKALMRDFDLYGLGIIDVQDVIGQYMRTRGLSDKLKVNLSEVVELFIGTKVDKSYQFYHYINRPINDKALEYACDDARLL
jgi:ribonuclease D